MDETAPEANVAAAAVAGGDGGGDVAAIVAAAPTNQGNVAALYSPMGGDIEISSENLDGRAPPARYSLRKRKPLLSSAQGNIASTSAAAGGIVSATDSNSSNSAVPPADLFGYVNTDTLTDRQFEKLLAKYEEDGVRERAQKKLRLERGYGDDDYPYVPPPEGCPQFHSLPKEAIQLVFELLPSARAVFNLAFQSKYMLSFVEERADIVIRAAVIGDALSSRGGENDETKTLRVIVDKVRSRSIHVPSALRLLRLLCAKRCERGSNCWGYDLKTKFSSTEGVTSGSRPFGLALCKSCGKDVGHRYWDRSWRNWEGNGRICMHGWCRFIDFDRAADVLTTPNGEQVGPIIEAKDINRIIVAHPKNTEGQDAYDKLLIECYGEEGSEERTSYEQECTDLVGLFTDADDELRAWLDNRQKEKREEARAKHDEAMAKKRENIEPILTALKAAVEDAPLKDLALDFCRHDSASEAVYFKYFFMRDTMGKLIKAPSSATAKNLTATLDKVKRKLTILSSSNDFFNLSFLSHAIESSTSSHEKRVLRELRVHAFFSTMKTVLIYDENKTNDRFFDLLEQREFFTAFLHLMEARDRLVDVAAPVVVSSTSNDLYNHRRLARVVFRKVDAERPRGTDGTLTEHTLSSFQSTVADVRREFVTMKTRARAYLRHQPVVDWAQGSELREEILGNIWNPRLSVLNRRYNSNFIWDDVRGLVPYTLLMDQDFDRLLLIHQFYYNWGGASANHYEASS